MLLNRDREGQVGKCMPYAGAYACLVLVLAVRELLTRMVGNSRQHKAKAVGLLLAHPTSVAHVPSFCFERRTGKGVCGSHHPTHTSPPCLKNVKSSHSVPVHVKEWEVLPEKACF